MQADRSEALSQWGVQLLHVPETFMKPSGFSACQRPRLLRTAFALRLVPFAMVCPRPILS